VTALRGGRGRWAPRSAIACAAACLSLLAAAPIGAQQAPPAPSATIVGTVRGPDAEPVVAAEILVGGELRARSDTLGRFAASGVAAGDVELLVRRFGYAPARVTLRLAPGSRRTLRVELQRAARTLAPVVVTSTFRGVFGRVRDTLARPLAGVEIDVLGARRTVRTGDDGAFAVDGLAAGPYVVVARLAGHRAARFSLTVPPDGGREVAIELGPLDAALGEGSALAESGFGRITRRAEEELAHRLRLREGSRAVVATRADLEPRGRMSVAQWLVLSGVVGARPGPRILGDLPSPVASGNVTGAGSGVISSATVAHQDFCLFLDGRITNADISLASIAVDELETIEVVRDDLSRTLSRQAELRIPQLGCGAYVVAWFRR
jgi:hypothetical protein